MDPQDRLLSVYLSTMSTFSDRTMTAIVAANLRYRSLYDRFPMLQANFLYNCTESDIIDQIIWTMKHAAAFLPAHTRAHGRVLRRVSGTAPLEGYYRVV